MSHSDGLGPHLSQVVSPADDLEAHPANPTTLLNYDPLQAKSEPLQSKETFNSGMNEVFLCLPSNKNPLPYRSSSD